MDFFSVVIGEAEDIRDNLARSETAVEITVSKKNKPENVKN
jgi:hypothetical protein